MKFWVSFISQRCWYTSISFLRSFVEVQISSIRTFGKLNLTYPKWFQYLCILFWNVNISPLIVTVHNHTLNNRSSSYQLKVEPPYGDNSCGQGGRQNINKTETTFLITKFGQHINEWHLISIFEFNAQEVRWPTLYAWKSD